MTFLCAVMLGIHHDAELCEVEAVVAVAVVLPEARLHVRRAQPAENRVRFIHVHKVLYRILLRVRYRSIVNHIYPCLLLYNLCIYRTIALKIDPVPHGQHDTVVEGLRWHSQSETIFQVQNHSTADLRCIQCHVNPVTLNAHYQKTTHRSSFCGL